MELTYGLLGVVLGWAASTALQSSRLHSMTWRMRALDRKVGLLLSHFALDERLSSWQKLAIDPSSSRLQAVKAYVDETGAGLAEAKATVEKWLGDR